MRALSVPTVAEAISTAGRSRQCGAARPLSFDRARLRSGSQSHSLLPDSGRPISRPSILLLRLVHPDLC